MPKNVPAEKRRIRHRRSRSGADLPSKGRIMSPAPYNNHEIPEGWELAKLADVATIHVGFPFDSSKFVETPAKETLPLVRIRDLQAGEAATYIQGPFEDEVLENYRVQPEDILVGMDGNFHVTKWRGEVALLNQRIARLKEISKDAPPDFIYFAVKAPIKRIEDNKHFTTVKHLSIGDLRNLTIPWPSTDERSSIASVLRTIQKAKEECERVIAATRQLKQSLLQHLFTYGPVPLDQADQVPLKETETGRISESWSPMKIGDIAQVRGGTGFPPEHQGSIEGEYPFLKVSDMNLVGNEVFMTKANNYISEAVRNQLRARPFKAGTIIFPKVGAALHTNKKRILVRDSLIDNNVMGVTVSSENRCLPEFLYRWFETINLSNLSNPGPLPSINGTRVKTTPIFLPTLVDQKEIATQFSAVDAKLAAEEARRDALSNLFQSLLHHLMTGKVRVTG